MGDRVTHAEKVYESLGMFHTTQENVVQYDEVCKKYSFI